MPHMRGPGTHKGYLSPKTGGWPPEVRDEVRRVYGAYRVKHPGESQVVKSRGARIAWSTARRKYPEAFRKHQLIEQESRKELKEHPWVGRAGARRIAEDHMKKTKDLMDPVQIKPARTAKGRRRQVRDLHAAARQEHAWARTAGNEQVSEAQRAKAARTAGTPVLASDLKQDAAVAGSFKAMRENKAENYDMQAERIRYVSGE
jgi:hypothetical protein